MGEAMNEELMKLIAQMNGGYYIDPDSGRMYQAQYSGGTEATEPQLQGFIGTDATYDGKGFSVGTPVTHYDLSGNKGMSYNVPKPEPMFDGLGDFIKSIAPVVLAAAGMNYAFPNGGVGFGGNLPIDAGGGGAGMDIGAGAGGSGGGFEAAPWTSAAADSQAANQALGLGANSAFSGGVSGIPASGSSWLSTIADAVGGKGNLQLLGALGGGLLGGTSKPATNQTTQRMDPRMDSYVYEGLLPRVNSLYQSQLDPNSQYQKDRAALKGKAKGLLGI